MWLALLVLPLWGAGDPLQLYLTGEPPRILREVEGARAPAGVRLRRVVFASHRSEIYALIAQPDKPGKFPGLVLFHGGGSSAEEAKALRWAARGYVVVSPDLPGVAHPEKAIHSRGPWKALPYGGDRWTVVPDVRASTLFDGVVAAMQSLYLLRSLPAVDVANAGVAGISWGGYMTTMVAGLAGPLVKAAFSVYGCGFYELTAMGGNGPLGKMPDSEREEWLRYLDPGRRVANMQATYFLAGATNDFFYWPPAVNATLQAIPGKKNQVFAANANHKATFPGGSENHTRGSWLAQEVEYFGYHLKGEGKPFPMVTVAPGTEASVARVRVSDAVEQVTLWWSEAGAEWMKREWSAIAMGRVGEFYEARLPVAAGDWFVTATDARPVTVSSPMMHVTQGR